MQLYKATEQSQERDHYHKGDTVYEILSLKDRAMLSIFYGCGLRRNEGYHLDVTDIHIESAIVHVRKGKGYKERFVPVSKKGIEHITTYLYDARPLIIRDGREEAFFLNHYGKRLGGQMLMHCVQALAIRTRYSELRQKEIGLHTLRH